MKPVDKFGREIYPRVFGRIKIIGEKLQASGWKESYKKPNLFFKTIQDTGVFADMRGTEIVPIWEAPYPLLYAARNSEAWKRRRALGEATKELDELEIPNRLSFFETCEPGGLFFGPEDELQDGTCKLCAKEFNAEGLFCSKDCEVTYSQLKEMRREEYKQQLKCAVCGQILEFWSKNTIEHHVNYKPEKVVHVCRSCHRKIHARHDLYPNLAPKKPPDWKAKGGWESS